MTVDDNNYDLCSNCNNYCSNILQQQLFLCLWILLFVLLNIAIVNKEETQNTDEQERRRCSCGFYFPHPQHQHHYHRRQPTSRIIRSILNAKKNQVAVAVVVARIIIVTPKQRRRRRRRMYTIFLWQLCSLITLQYLSSHNILRWEASEGSSSNLELSQRFSQLITTHSFS